MSIQYICPSSVEDPWWFLSTPIGLSRQNPRDKTQKEQRTIYMRLKFICMCIHCGSEIFFWCHSSHYRIQSMETLTYSLLEMCDCNLTKVIYKRMSRIDIFSSFYEIDPNECHKTSLMITQYWFRQYLGASRNKPLYDAKLTKTYIAVWRQ